MIPRPLRQLAEATDLPRPLYLPELKAACSLAAAGLPKPFPGVSVRSHDLEVALSLFRTFWVIEIEGVTVTMVSKAWSASKRRPAVRCRNIESSFADAEFRA